MNRFLNLAFGACALVWPALANAAPGDGTRLEYARTEQAVACPDQAALQREVVKHLGYDPFLPAARQTIVVEITGEADGVHARMHLVDEHGMIVGSRELRERTEHCDELVASLALAISIALDPSAAPEEKPNSSAEAPKSEPEHVAEVPVAPVTAAAQPAMVTPSSAPAPAPAPSKPQPTRLQTAAESEPSPIALRASGFGALGAAPAPAVGFRLGASARAAWFRAVVELVDQLPASKTVDQVGGARASLLAVTVAPCAVVYGAFAGCAVLGVGSLHAEGREILDANSQHLWNVTLGARVEFAPTLVGRLRLLANLDADRSLTPYTLRVHSEMVWKNPAISPALGVGLGWQF